MQNSEIFDNYKKKKNEASSLQKQPLFKVEIILWYSVLTTLPGVVSLLEA